jgi:hypothetical protein
MTTWEYCLVNRTGILYFTPTGYSEDQRRDFWQAVAKLGEEGWEMVTMSDGAAYFKRPLDG